jgi:hypothetical protein
MGETTLSTTSTSGPLRNPALAANCAARRVKRASGEPANRKNR